MCQGKKHLRDFSVRPAKSSGYCWVHLTWPDTACASALRSRHQPCSTAPGAHSQPMQVTCVITPMMFHFGLRSTDRHSVSTVLTLLKTRAPHSQLLLVWFPPLSTCSAPEWVLSITNLGITTAALVVVLPDLVIIPPHSPNSFGILTAPESIHLISPPQCWRIFSLGQVRLPFFDFSFQRQRCIWR